MKPICETCHKGIPLERFQGVALCERCEKVVTRRLAAVEAERDEARGLLGECLQADDGYMLGSDLVGRARAHLGRSE